MYFEFEISKLHLEENIGKVLVKKLVLFRIYRFNVDENTNNCVEINQLKETKMLVIRKVVL